MIKYKLRTAINHFEQAGLRNLSASIIKECIKDVEKLEQENEKLKLALQTISHAHKIFSDPVDCNIRITIIAREALR